MGSLPEHFNVDLIPEEELLVEDGNYLVPRTPLNRYLDTKDSAVYDKPPIWEKINDNGAVK